MEFSYLFTTAHSPHLNWSAQRVSHLPFPPSLPLDVLSLRIDIVYKQIDLPGMDKRDRSIGNESRI